jgi:hypothetical protein
MTFLFNIEITTYWIDLYHLGLTCQICYPGYETDNFIENKCYPRYETDNFIENKCYPGYETDSLIENKLWSLDPNQSNVEWWNWRKKSIKKRPKKALGLTC